MPRSQKRRTNKRRVSRGGAGTASWKAYGGIGQQTSNPSEGNHIQSKVGGSSWSPAKYGGKKQQRQQGAGIFNELALPAMLIYANNAYGKSRSSSSPSFSRKSSFSRRNSFSRRRSASRRD